MGVESPSLTRSTEESGIGGQGQADRLDRGAEPAAQHAVEPADHVAETRFHVQRADGSSTGARPARSSWSRPRNVFAHAPVPAVRCP